jgi:hypothetical protein
VLRPDLPLPYLPLSYLSLSYEPPAAPRSNAATRLAPFLRSATSTEVGPQAEAAIAWWHAYEAHRRRLVIAALVVVFVLTAVALRIQQVAGSGGW